jgi:hypothetical protein
VCTTRQNPGVFAHSSRITFCCYRAYAGPPSSSKQQPPAFAVVFYSGHTHQAMQEVRSDNQCSTCRICCIAVVMYSNGKHYIADMRAPRLALQAMLAVKPELQLPVIGCSLSSGAGSAALDVGRIWRGSIASPEGPPLPTPQPNTFVTCLGFRLPGAVTVAPFTAADDSFPVLQTASSSDNDSSSSSSSSSEQQQQQQLGRLLSAKHKPLVLALSHPSFPLHSLLDR